MVNIVHYKNGKEEENMITDDDRIRIAKKLKECNLTEKYWYYSFFMDEFFKAIELPNEQYNWREYLAELIVPDSI